MRFAAVLPYLVPGADHVSAAGWETLDGSPVVDRVAHWDPSTDLEFTAAVTIDLDGIRASCQLADDSCLALATSWSSSRTRLAGTPNVVELGDLTGVVKAPATAAIPGATSGGFVDLTIALVLRHPGATTSPIAARRPGALLWSERTRVVLEGSGARFPIAAVDFAAVPRGRADAQWSLEWDGADPNGLVLADLRLLINSASSDLVAALKSGSDDPRSQVVRSFILFDVARSLVYGGLTNEAFLEAPDNYDDGTVGQLIRDLLAATWPAIPAKALAELLTNDPARINRDLQAHLRIFR